jgi:asparagine synthase (glutamine-hydrolysing)
MMASQRHRGPDDAGCWIDTDGAVGLGHNRLSILDLSAAGRQPMWSGDGRRAIIFNGEIYNFRELRTELGNYRYRSRTDTEVILAAYERWGEHCLERFIGMFAFLIWDTREHRVFAARDRFGVKPLYYHLRPNGTLLAASEIKALLACGVEAVPDARTWATYLVHGLYDHSERTFWDQIQSLPPGHSFDWRGGRLHVRRWYDIADRVGHEFDERPETEVRKEYLALLEDSIRLRFRADVPVGINLSGGLDSSTLLGLVQAIQGRDSEVKAFTFVTGDPCYDELPWVRQMLEQTRHPLVVCELEAADVPALADSASRHEDEPFGGLPTLAYARLFEQARAAGVKVLLDGQGMDEQWGGYDYYSAAVEGGQAGLVQGTSDRPVRPECVQPELAALAEPFSAPRPFADELQNAQYRDLRHTKIPRALRFNDRVSMRASTELREPFLDHRLVELALRQRPERKIAGRIRKRMLREIAAELVPRGVIEAPKRPLQTPQREWLRGSLRRWAQDRIESAISTWGGTWMDSDRVRAAWRAYLEGASDNSHYVWQWISLDMLARRPAPRFAAAHE